MFKCHAACYGEGRGLGNSRSRRLLQTELGFMPAAVGLCSALEHICKQHKQTTHRKLTAGKCMLMIYSLTPVTLSRTSHLSLWLSVYVRSLHLGESRRTEVLHNGLFISWADWQVQSCTVCLIWRERRNQVGAGWPLCEYGGLKVILVPSKWIQNLVYRDPKGWCFSSHTHTHTNAHSHRSTQGLGRLSSCQNWLFHAQSQLRLFVYFPFFH